MLPSPDSTPDLRCDIESFEGQDQHSQSEEVMPSPPSSSHDDKALSDTVLEQRDQLHQGDMMLTPELQKYDTESLQTMDSPLGLEITHEDEPHKKRARVDSLLTPVSNLAEEDIGLEDHPVPPFKTAIEKRAFEGIHEVWTSEEEKVIPPTN